MTSELIKQIKKILKQDGFCAVSRGNITLKQAVDFANENHLSLELLSEIYLFRINTVQQKYQKIEKREQQRHINQHILFTVLATFFFLILWLDLFKL